MGYVLSDANANATNLNVFEHGVSGLLTLTKGSGSVVGEAVLGISDNPGNAYGLNTQLGYFVTNKLQFVSRLQVAFSEKPDGLTPQQRYEQPPGFAPGDFYHAEYFGTNYHLAGHRIKWMNGIEYSELGGDSLWTLSTAIRIFWGPHSSGPYPIAATLPGHWH